MFRRRAVRLSLVGGGVTFVVLLVVLIVLVVTFVRRPLPERGGTVAVRGLTGSVTVVRDERGVPQIYADHPEDLMRGQGFVDAQDRFFEMDVRRHLTAGRLSELVGENDDALAADKFVRTLGWRRVAQQELPTLSPTTRSYLDAYAAGVNEYLRGRSPSRLSVSYTILARANPLSAIEPWTALDSLTWLKAMAWDLRSNFDDELGRARSVGNGLSVSRINRLYPPYPYGRHTSIIPSAQLNRAQAAPPTLSAATTASTSKTSAAADVTQAARTQPAQRALTRTSDALAALAPVKSLMAAGDGIGSNSWAISGALTATGKPLLANDPHLDASMPGVWHQTGLHCRTVSATCAFDVSGFSFAGLPGIVIGHNDRIAWGLTNMAPDVIDLYLEDVDGEQVRSGESMVPLTVRNETIKVAGGDPVPLTIRSSSHGPLLSDIDDDVRRAGSTAPVADPPGSGEGEPHDDEPSATTSPAPSDDSTDPDDDENNRSRDYAVAMQWTALQPGHAMDALLEMNVAGTVDDFRSAVQKLDAPAQNVVFATTDGHIGYQAPGRIPVRGPGRADAPVPGNGTWPHPGWDSAYDWQGTVPTKSMPWTLDPPEGFISSSNQAVTYAGDGPFLTSDWDYGYRSQRIRQLLQNSTRGGRKLTVADMRSIQTDTKNQAASTLVPLLLQIDVKDTFTQEAVDLLRDWDQTQPTDSAAAAYFNVVWANLLDLTFGDELPEGFKPDGGDRWYEVVQFLLTKPKDAWWDERGTPSVVETRDEVLRQALTKARLQLTSTLGKDPDRWEWGRLHRVSLRQTPLGGSGVPGPVHWLVNRGPYEAPGGGSIVNAFSWNAASGTFDVTSAPSMRMIVDLGDLDRSRWVTQTGVSGHPADSHYDDQIEAWLKGDDYPWAFSRRAVDEAADQTQTLQPR